MLIAWAVVSPPRVDSRSTERHLDTSGFAQHESLGSSNNDKVNYNSVNNKHHWEKHSSCGMVRPVKTVTAYLRAPNVLPVRPPRLGFIGTGAIGRVHMQALLEADCAECKAVFDPSDADAQEAVALAGGIQRYGQLQDFLKSGLDGVVIATPTALHTEHCIAALQSGLAVFCQKPLARSFAETIAVVDAARSADRLLAVEFCYRHIAGMAELRRLMSDGELGQVFAADLVFHGAHSSDKPWFYEAASAGGGCVMDLGIHLVDLAMWLLGNRATKVTSSLYRQGVKLTPPHVLVEDYATAKFFLDDTEVRLTCSWNLHAGHDATIEARFYGTNGGAAVRNVRGSFEDFEIHHFTATSSRQIAGYPDTGCDRALVDWVTQLKFSNRFDPQAEQALAVAEVVDRIYSR